MRTRRDFLIVTFATTTGAMAFEAYAEKNNIAGRLIPLPSEISAGCGLSWRTEPSLGEEILRELSSAGLETEGMYIVKMYG